MIAQQLKALGRDVIRRYGIATASLRPPPDFLVIGAKRSGTTSLYHALLGHPQVLPLFPSLKWPPIFQHPKGLRYFDRRYGLGEDWYLSHFPTRWHRRLSALAVGEKVVVGEATPRYLPHPHAPSRAAALVPGARLILLLRDPVERCFSHYRSMVRDGRESLSFEEALEAEPSRLRGESERLVADASYRSHGIEVFSYIDTSRYVVGVRRWLMHFDRSQLLVRRAEDFFARPQAILDDVARHLGIRPQPLAQKVLNAAPSHALREETRLALRESLAESVEELRSVLGQDIRWW